MQVNGGQPEVSTPDAKVAAGMATINDVEPAKVLEASTSPTCIYGVPLATAKAGGYQQQDVCHTGDNTLDVSSGLSSDQHAADEILHVSKATSNPSFQGSLTRLTVHR